MVLNVLKHSLTSPNFVEPKGLLSCSQQTATRPYPEPDKFSPSHPADYRIHFNVTLTSIP